MKAASPCPAVIIADPSTALEPGECDIAGCTAPAGYSLGNYYLCADCLIESCENGKIPLGTVVYRLQERHHFY